MSGLEALTWVKSLELDMSDSMAGFLRDFLDMCGLKPNMSDKLYDRWTCPGSNPNLPSERGFISEWLEPISSHPIGLTGMVDRSDRFALTAPMARFFRFL
jgi:hypothetical protein